LYYYLQDPLNWRAIKGDIAMAKAKATRTITLTDDQREYLQLFITLDKESAIAIEIGVSILTVKKTFHNLGKDIETVVKR